METVVVEGHKSKRKFVRQFNSETIRVILGRDEDPDQRIYNIHADKLKAASEYFAGLFRFNGKELETREVRLKDINDLFDAFEAFVEFIYTGSYDDKLWPTNCLLEAQIIVLAERLISPEFGRVALKRLHNALSTIQFTESSPAIPPISLRDEEMIKIIRCIYGGTLRPEGKILPEDITRLLQSQQKPKPTVQTPSRAGGLFGGAAPPTGASLFGSARPATQSTQPATGAPLFGAARPATQSAQQPTSLFGQPLNQPAQQPIGGLFGQASNQPTQQPGNLFGTNQSTQQPAGALGTNHQPQGSATATSGAAVTCSACGCENPRCKVCKGCTTATAADYENKCYRNSKARRIVARYAAFFLRDYRKNPEFRELIREFGEFAEDLIMEEIKVEWSNMVVVEE